jgi:hypothetical protein
VQMVIGTFLMSSVKGELMNASSITVGSIATSAGGSLSSISIGIDCAGSTIRILNVWSAFVATLRGYILESCNRLWCRYVVHIIFIGFL